eukprot:6447223-Pyramimonas_sp.AAC.1
MARGEGAPVMLYAGGSSVQYPSLKSFMYLTADAAEAPTAATVAPTASGSYGFYGLDEFYAPASPPT